MHRPQRIDRINIVPFVDIVLVLMVIVMATAHFSKEQLLHMTLPRADTADKATATKKVGLLQIDREGRYRLDGHTMGDKALETYLRTHAADYRTWQIRADKTTPFEAVVGAIDLLRALQIRHFSITVTR